MLFGLSFRLVIEKIYEVNGGTPVDETFGIDSALPLDTEVRECYIFLVNV